MGIRGLLLILTCGGLGPAWAVTTDDVAQDSTESRTAAFAAMDSVYARFTRAYRLGEPDSVIVLYTDDPLYLPVSGDIRRGRAQLAEQFAFLRNIASEGGKALISFESVAREVSGGIGYDVGYYTLQVERADGARSDPSRGKFVTVWMRSRDGAWRIHIDSFSPAPPAEG